MSIYKDKDINDTPALLLRSADAKDVTFGSLTIPDRNPTPSQTSSTGSRQLSSTVRASTPLPSEKTPLPISLLVYSSYLTPNADYRRP